MKKLVRSIGNIFDSLACIIPAIFLMENCDASEHPIAYGILVLGGLLVCACGVFGMLLLVSAIVCFVATYPITSCSIALVFASFVGIGFLRKKIEEEANDREGD